MKRFISIVLIIIFALSSTGCSRTKQEIDKLSVALAIGFDLTPEGKYVFSAQILSTESKPSTSVPKKSPSNVVVFTSSGNTPYDAINHISTTLGKNLFFGHSAYIIVGNRLAENGLSLILDATLRNSDTRPDSPLLLAKGNALDIIKATTADEKIPASAIDNILKFQVSKGYIPKTSRLDFANSLASKTSAPILGLISLEKGGNSDNTFVAAGTGVFKRDKLIGYLNKNETRGMQWIDGKIQSGNLIVQTPDSGMITFDILKSKATVKPILKNDKITIKINIKEEANVVEMTEDIDVMKTPDKIKKLNELQNQAIKTEVLSALNAAQKKLKADVFHFGSKVHRQYPKFWKTAEGDWDNIFPNLNVEVNIDSSVKRPGIISKPIK